MLLLSTFLSLALAQAPASANPAQAATQEAAQPTLNAPAVQALTPELLVAHPALVRGDNQAWTSAVMDALEANPIHPLAPLAATLVSEHSEGLSPDALAEHGARLTELAERVTDAEASLALRRGIHANAKARRFGPRPLDLPGDLFPEFITDWLVVGPLGALDERMTPTAPAPDLSALFGEGGLDRFSPEPAPNVSELGQWRIPAAFTAADGAPRTWTPVRRAPNQTGARWRSQVHPEGGQTYALAFVAAEAESAALTLEVRTTKGARVWWNGALVIDAPRLSGLEFGKFVSVGVQAMPAGWNSLLIRTETNGGAPLSARLIDGAGGTVALRQPTDLSVPEGGWTLPVPESNDAPQGALPQRGSRDALLASMRSVKDLPFGRALGLLQASLQGRPDIALAQGRVDDLSPAEQAAWLRQRLIALRIAPHLPGELRRRLALEVIEELRGMSVLGKVGYEYDIARLLREDKPAEALAAAEEFLALQPDLDAARFARVRALRRLDRSGVLAKQALEQLVLDRPHHAEAQLSLARLLSKEGEPILALDHAWAALRADATGGDALNEVLAAFEVSGDERLEILLGAAQRWEAAHDAGSVAPGELRELLGRSGRFEDLAALQEAHAAKNPAQANAWWVLGNGRLRLGNEEGAREAFRKELRLNPSDWTTRELLARLGDEDPAEAFFAAFAPDASAALAAAKDAQQASVVEALDSGLVYFFPDGSIHGRYRTLTQPLDRTGAEELNAVPVAEGTRSIRITKESGDTQEPVEVNGEWVMPALEPGDVIDTVWDRIEPGVPGAAPMGQLWRFASFARAFPTSRWALYVPDGLPGELELLHFEGTHEEVPFQNGTVHVLTASHEQFQEEPLRPTDVEVLPIATFGANRDRADELRSWWGYAARKTEIPADLEGELREFMGEALQDVDPADQRAKAEALYVAVDDYLQTFEGDEDAASVWLTKKGWPAFLLGSLYERAAIPYRWAVLKSGLAPELEPPTPAVFEGVASLAQIVLRLGIEDEAGDPIWVIHSGAPGAPFGALRTQTAGAEAWILDGPDGTAHEEALPRTQAMSHWNLNLSVEYVLQADGSAAVSGRLTDASPGGMVLIEQIRQATAQQRDGFAKSQAAQFSPGVDLEEARIVLDGSEGEGMILLFGGVARDFATARGDESVAAIPFVPLQLDRAFGPAERRWPLAMRQVTRLRVRIHVDPGTAWTLVEGVEGASVERPGLEVALDVIDDPDGGRTYEQRFVQRGLMLEAAELPDFLARMGEMEQEYRRPLRLKKR